MVVNGIAAAIAQQAGFQPYRRSIVAHEGTTYFLAATPRGKRLGILAGNLALPAGFVLAPDADVTPGPVLLELSHENATALRRALPWLQPRPLGLSTSAGCGDRLGLATPGHVRAARAVGGIAMIFAQQSIREMSRTARTPEQVLDDATWGAFQEGWQEPVGADADHLKTPADATTCAHAGYTFFTIDPGEHVDPQADTADAAALQEKLDALPWDALERVGRTCSTAMRNTSTISAICR